MTNLLASIVVTVVTNTVEEFPKILVPADSGSPDPIFAQGAYFTPAIFIGKWINDPHATHKTNVTTCKEITTLRFDWHGPREVMSERVLWETNRVLKLDWVPK